MIYQGLQNPRIRTDIYGFLENAGWSNGCAKILIDVLTSPDYRTVNKIEYKTHHLLDLYFGDKKPKNLVVLLLACPNTLSRENFEPSLNREIRWLTNQKFYQKLYELIIPRNNWSTVNSELSFFSPKESEISIIVFKSKILWKSFKNLKI